MLADVAQRRGAEQGVGHGVEDHVGVGMAEQAQRVVYFDATQDQRPPRHESMRVMSQSDAHGNLSGENCELGFRFARPRRSDRNRQPPDLPFPHQSTTALPVYRGVSIVFGKAVFTGRG